MRRILFASLILAVAALAAQSGAELFQKALTAERAAGNLEEAIKLYQRIAKEFASDRALAAKAIVQEARCYEKLGQNKAIQLYEQVAREYKDQAEPSAAATARLAALKLSERPAAPATMTQRKVDLAFSDEGVPEEGVAETDGQRQIYVDAATGALMICDVAGKNKRVILKPKAGDHVVFFLPSRDFSMVDAVLQTGNDYRRAVIKTDGAGYRELGVRSPGGDCLPDWSWDNRYILACETQPDGALKISVADGERRKLGETHSQVHRFSPDGRFIAYGRTPTISGQILVGSSQGGELQVISENANLLDWTRDGRYLAITMDRSGSGALYLLPMKNGRQAGDPVFVRYGSFEYGRATAGGALLYQSTLPAGNLFWLGTLDSDGRVAGWERLSLSGSGMFPTEPAWSPDSTQIAYAAANQASGQNTWTVRMRNMASGEERELYRGGPDRTFCIWAAQHPNLFCGQYPPQHTTEVFSVSIDSGRVERLGSLPGNSPLLFTSRDDRAIYMAPWDPKLELIRWEISTQHTTTLDRSPGLILGRGVASADERWMARWGNGKIEIRPMSGGDWKPVASAADTSEIAFTQDGNWLLYHDVDARGKHSLFRVATAGGQPERLGDFPGAGNLGYLWISPDGQKIIAQTGSASEAWILENFEPKQTAGR